MPVFLFAFFLCASFCVLSCTNTQKVSSQEVSSALSARFEQLRKKTNLRVKEADCKGNIKCERGLSMAVGDSVACLEKTDNPQHPSHQVVEGSIQCMEELNTYLDTLNK